MSTTPLTILDPRVEYRVNPLGISVERPRFSWTLQGDGRNRYQSAYQIVVGTEQGESDLWDSGKIESSQTGQIRYQGLVLKSSQRAWWRVRIWDETGQESAWSEPSYWEAALLKLKDWRGVWISHPDLKPDLSIEEARELDALVPPPVFRRSFQIDKPVVRARLYSTARGVYEAYLNGQKLGDQVLAPGWTDYNKRIQIQTYDVTTNLQSGENVLGAIVAPGWYAGYFSWDHEHRHYGTSPQFLAHLLIEFEDGTTQIVGSGKDWRVTTGSLRYADLLMGEYRDARLEQPGWNAPGFDDTDWLLVQTSNVGFVPLIGDVAEPIRAQDELKPVSVTQSPSGGWIFDLGQNIAGRVRLKTRGEAGTTLTLHHAEILDADGSLYITNLRGARVIDTFALAGTGEETFEPTLTWHGFRYVEVRGLAEKPDLDAITGVFVGSDIAPAWEFDSSDALLNQLQRNIDWGMRDNFLSIPTDCPQRDERLGWTGDAEIFAGTAMANRDVAGFFTKWMQDLVDAQSEAGAFSDVAPRLSDLNDGAAAWADCGVILPWTMWQAYGDTEVIDRHWQAMERWMDWLERGNPDLLWLNNRNNDFGEWLSIGADTPKDVIASAFWAYDARLMAEMAEATGRDADATRYRDLFDRLCAKFVETYVDAEGRVQGETQACYVLALHFGLLPEDLVPKAVEHLLAAIAEKNDHLSTGFVGCSYLLPVLTAHGHGDLAYKLLHNQTFPSWKYSILHGATTIWERWDGWTEDKGFQDPGMNSFNHYSFGSVGEWMKNSLVGLAPVFDEPGYEQVRIAPQIHHSLTFAEGTYRSVRGPIRVRWERDGGEVRVQAEIPANVQAEIQLPGSVVKADGIKDLQQSGDGAILRTGSGSYSLITRLDG